MRLAFTENDEADETNLPGHARNCISRIIQLLGACIIRHPESMMHSKLPTYLVSTVEFDLSQDELRRSNAECNRHVTQWYRALPHIQRILHTKRHSISHPGRLLCGHSINHPPCPHHIAASQVPVPADLRAAPCIVYDRCLSNCRAERVCHVVGVLHRFGNGLPRYCDLANGDMRGQSGRKTTSSG